VHESAESAQQGIYNFAIVQQSAMSSALSNRCNLLLISTRMGQSAKVQKVQPKKDKIKFNALRVIVHNLLKSCTKRTNRIHD
jgi:hypothetical protein